MNGGVLQNAYRNFRDRYKINLTLKVGDAEALWEAAARRALASTAGLTLTDVEDMFGPREAPSITDCLAMLMFPDDMSGYVVTDFQTSEDHDGPAPDRGEPAKSELMFRPVAGITLHH